LVMALAVLLTRVGKMRVMVWGVETTVALAADHLVAVVLLGQETQRRLNHNTTIGRAADVMVMVWRRA